MRGASGVAGRTRCRRGALAQADAGGAIGRRRKRGGSDGSPRPSPPPGDGEMRREIPVIVLDDDDDDDDDGQEGAALHDAPSPWREPPPVVYPVAARTRSRMAPFCYGRGAGSAIARVPADASGCSWSSASESDGRDTGDRSCSGAECSEGSVEDSGSGGSPGLADGGSSETAVSVNGGGGGEAEDLAEGNQSVGDELVVASCCGPSSQSNSGELNLVSSGDSLSISIRGESTGGGVESGGGSFVSETRTEAEQMRLQSLLASSESTPSGGADPAGESATAEGGAAAPAIRDSGSNSDHSRGIPGSQDASVRDSGSNSNHSRGADPAGESATDEGGAAATSIRDSGSNSNHCRGIPGSQDASGAPGGMRGTGIEPRNCVARRTRSNLFGDKYRTIDYTSYFKESRSSDSEDEEIEDSDSEEWLLWSPSSLSSLLSSSSSVSSSESNGEVGRFSDSDMENMDTHLSTRGGKYKGDSEPAAKKKRFSWHSNFFSTVGTKDHVDDSVSIGSTGVSHSDGEKNVGSDGRTSVKKLAEISVLDGDGGFEGKIMPTPPKKHQSTKRHKLRICKSKKRKRMKSMKDDSLFKMFIETILGKAETLPEDLLHPKTDSLLLAQTSVKNEESLPLVFAFGDEDPKPVEKSEHEQKLDELWAEFDFVLNSNDIGSYKPYECEHEVTDVQEDNIHQSILCNKEGHQLILDEQIGIRCKLCSFVWLEIRYILPSLATERSGGIFGEQIFRSQENLPLLDELLASENQCNWGVAFELSNGTVWDVIPGVKSTLYPHQQEAFEFMWKNLAGDIFLDKLKKSACYDGLGGCVISHAPGTGKSRLTIVFLQAFLRVFPECRPVIVAPRGMLLTWKKEFEKWKFDIPVHVLNEYQFSGKEDAVALRLVLGKHRKRQWSRVVKLFSWDKGGSILAMSYCLFEKLVGSLNKQGTANADVGKILLDRPDLFVFDEGHTPRNERSLIWKALGKIKTERRIILSGTPFQNNFGELYNTFCLVRPKFTDKISCATSKFCQRRDFMMENDENPSARDERRGKWASLTSSITDERLEELRLMMKPFVHVHNGSSLRSLPGLKDCLIVLDPLPRQKNILEIIEDIRSDTVFAMEYKISLASVHPSLLTACALSGKEVSAIDNLRLESIRLKPNEGVKTRFVFELVRLCQALNERVLVFSQYIEPMELIAKQLGPLFGWKEGTEILKMDGKMRPKHRQILIDDFNDAKSKARVLLASIKACSEGISLTGASRVVLLDVVWNPSVERQAISRAYRLGQEKVVYIYHLITYGTGEGDKYYKQVEKDRLSKLVFSSANGNKNVQDDSFSVSEDKILKEMVGHDKLKDMFKRILYQPKESNLIDAFMF